MVQQGRPSFYFMSRLSAWCSCGGGGGFVSKDHYLVNSRGRLGEAGEVVAARELGSFRPRGRYSTVLCEERGVGQARRKADLAVLTSSRSLLAVAGCSPVPGAQQPWGKEGRRL